MAGLKDSFKRAFAVDPPGPAEPNDEQRVIIDRLAKEVVRRQLTTPSLLFLEMSRPLNFIGSQALHFFTPIISAVVDTRGYEQFAGFLERRGSVDYICRRIENFEQEKLMAGGSGPGGVANVTRDSTPPANS